MFHVIFADCKTRAELIEKTILSAAAEPGVYDLIYVFDQSIAHQIRIRLDAEQRDMRVASEIVSMLLGMTISDATCVYIQNAKASVAAAYIGALCEINNVFSNQDGIKLWCEESKDSKPPQLQLLPRVCGYYHIHMHEGWPSNKDIMKLKKHAARSYDPKARGYVAEILNQAGNLEALHKVLIGKGNKWTFVESQDDTQRWLLLSTTNPEKPEPIIINTSELEIVPDLAVYPGSATCLAKIAVSHQALARMEAKHAFWLVNPKAKKLLRDYVRTEKANKIMIYASEDPKQGRAFRFALYLAEAAVVLAANPEGEKLFNRLDAVKAAHAFAARKCLVKLVYEFGCEEHEHGDDEKEEVEKEEEEEEEEEKEKEKEKEEKEEEEAEAKAKTNPSPYNKEDSCPMRYTFVVKTNRLTSGLAEFMGKVGCTQHTEDGIAHDGFAKYIGGKARDFLHIDQDGKEYV